MTDMADNNDKAVVLSEEVDFLDSLMARSGEYPADITDSIIERRDALRAAMATDDAAGPDDAPEEGTTAPDPEAPE